MNSIEFILATAWFLLSLKAILKYLYLAQLKEYRRDRLWAFWSLSSGKRFFLPGQHLLKPKATLKAAVLLVIVLMFELLLAAKLPIKHFYKRLLFSFLTIPLLVVWALVISLPFDTLIKKIIVQLARLKISKHKTLTVIGVTGSYGKTTTKEIIADLLSKRFKVLKTRKTENTIIGIAKTILRELLPDHQIFVVEMGAYKKGEIKKICQLTRPKIGVLTGLNEQHLALFGSLKQTLAAKCEILKALPKNGLAVVNDQDIDFDDCLKDILARVIRYQSITAVFKDRFQGQKINNLYPAYVIGRHLGLQKEEIGKAFESLSPFLYSLKVIKNKNGILVIDDSYSSNPHGFAAALDYLISLRGHKKIVVTPGIIELGRASFNIHKQLGKKMSGKIDLLILTSGDFVKAFKQGVGLAAKKPKIVVFENRQSLCNYLSQYLTKGDCLLLEGRVPEEIKTITGT